MEENGFKMFVPFELIKGAEVCDKKGKKRKMVFKGVASDNREDLDGETLDPNGFDYSLFLKAGHFNWNHQAGKDPLAIVGEPTSAIVKNNKFEIEGFLYEESELANKIYKLQEIFEKSGSDRRLGFSIEGVATERDPLNKKYIKKAKIMNVAIAPTPKNMGTSMSLVKAFEYDTVASVTDEIIVDVVADGERVLMNKAFDIVIVNEKAIVMSDEQFKRNVMTIHKAITDGSVIVDMDSVKAKMATYKPVFGGTVWISEDTN